MAKAELVSAAEFARRLKITSEAVRQAKDAGVFKGALVQLPGRVHPLIKYKLGVRYYESRLDPTFREMAKVGKKTKGGNGKPGKKAKQPGKTLIDARAEVQEYRAKELKLKHEINAGLWIKKKDVADQAFRAGRLARDNILNIPSRLAALLAAESDQSRVFGMLHKELKAVLDEFVDQLAQIAK